MRKYFLMILFFCPLIVIGQCSTQLGVNDFPTLTWMLDGGQGNYQSYSNNSYFTFNSDWLSDDVYLCGGVKRKHTGWDIHKLPLNNNIPEISGTRVFAVLKGKVRSIYNAGSGFAKGIVIEHEDLKGNKFTSTYMHVVPIIFEVDCVVAGQQIANVANISAKPNHLHFGLRKHEYDDFSHRGALPKNINSACTLCSNPVFPEFFVNPGLCNYTDVQLNFNQTINAGKTESPQ